MTSAGTTIILAWVVLFALLFASRRIWMNQSGPATAIAGFYLCLCAASLFLLGDGWQKWAGAITMSLPLMAAALFFFR